jgi:hypothetical protein
MEEPKTVSIKEEISSAQVKVEAQDEDIEEKKRSVAGQRRS